MCCRTLWSYESFLEGVSYTGRVSREGWLLMVYVFSSTFQSNSMFKTGTVGNDTTKKLGDETSACSVDIESWRGSSSSGRSSTDCDHVQTKCDRYGFVSESEVEDTDLITHVSACRDRETT